VIDVAEVAVLQAMRRSASSMETAVAANDVLLGRPLGGSGEAVGSSDALFACVAVSVGRFPIAPLS